MPPTRTTHSRAALSRRDTRRPSFSSGYPSTTVRNNVARFDALVANLGGGDISTKQTTKARGGFTLMLTSPLNYFVLLCVCAYL